VLVGEIVGDGSGQFDVAVERWLIRYGGQRERESDRVAKRQLTGLRVDIADRDILAGGRVLPRHTRILDVDTAEHNRSERAAVALILAIAREIVEVGDALGVAGELYVKTVDDHGVHLESVAQ